MRREMLQGRLDARAGEEGGGSCSEGCAQSYRLLHVQVVLPAQPHLSIGAMAARASQVRSWQHR